MEDKGSDLERGREKEKKSKERRRAKAGQRLGRIRGDINLATSATTLLITRGRLSTWERKRKRKRKREREREY